MGTPFQEVYDQFFAKVPDEDFTYKADLAYQYLKTANGYAYKTVPESLTCTLNTDNVVLYISTLATVNGNIAITINTVVYTVSILSTDSLIGIANKVKAAINSEYTVETDFSYIYPILTITKTGVTTITANFQDTGGTGAVVHVTKSYDGSYADTLGIDSIELLALYMASQHYTAKLSSLNNVKQHVGTKDFDKIPYLKNSYDTTNNSLSIIDDRIIMFKQDFNTFIN